ncbi:MAG: glutaredoxin family protein [Thaumarchaeota archaeon]|nr:glutaredoxin family protein [Nitrososphaerota archaeon]
MHKIVVYSKDGCHLCERAIDTLRKLSVGNKFVLEIVTINSDQELFRKYFLSIPVVQVNGKDVLDAEDIGLANDCKTKLTNLVQDLEDLD